MKSAVTRTSASFARHLIGAISIVWLLAPGVANVTLWRIDSVLTGAGVGGMIMTLWGGNGWDSPNSTFAGGPPTSFGVDLRLQMTKLPAPSSLALLAAGLLGLGFMRRKNDA